MIRRILTVVSADESYFNGNKLPEFEVEFFGNSKFRRQILEMVLNRSQFNYSPQFRSVIPRLRFGLQSFDLANWSNLGGGLRRVRVLK